MFRTSDRSDVSVFKVSVSVAMSLNAFLHCIPLPQTAWLFEFLCRNSIIPKYNSFITFSTLSSLIAACIDAVTSPLLPTYHFSILESAWLMLRWPRRPVYMKASVIPPLVAAAPSARPPQPLKTTVHPSSPAKCPSPTTLSAAPIYPASSATGAPPTPTGLSLRT